MQVNKVLTSVGKFQPYSIEIKVETEGDAEDLQMIDVLLTGEDDLTNLGNNVSGGEEAAILHLLRSVSDCSRS